MVPRRSVQILLVEDSPTDVLLAEEAIANYPEFQVAHVERLTEAVRTLSALHFDLVLLDLSLPDSQGLDTLLRLRQAIPTIPIVVMTGRDDLEVALRSVQA